MKFLHIADLHIGKRLNEFSMIENQQYILEQIIEIAIKEKPDGILIAGDVYDKNLPSVEAVEILDDFLTKISIQNIPVFLISGNHDSPERLEFGSRILNKHHLFIAGKYNGTIEKETLIDEWGPVHIYLLPFLKPAMVKPYFEQEILTYDDGVRAVIESIVIDQTERNILLAHQFVTNQNEQPERTDSESITIGGLDNIEVSIFDSFDYVALGHLHGSQLIGRDTVRYAGSILKYSFSEVNQQKSVTIIELKKKGESSIRLVPLIPKYDMRIIKGPIHKLIEIGKEKTEDSNDYIHAILTDEEEIYDALGQLRQIYKNIMSIDYENNKYKKIAISKTEASDVKEKTPLELFSEFYLNQNNNELTKEQLEYVKTLFQKVLEVV